MSMTSTMSRPSPVARLAALRAGLALFPRSALELMARIAVGATFFRSGLLKTDNWQTTLGLFADEYKVPLLPPEIAAYLGTAAELICPVLIVFGIFARLGAAGLLGMTAVIQIFVYPANWTEHLMWATILLYILTRGAGAISLDRFIAKSWFGDR